MSVKTDREYLIEISENMGKVTATVEYLALTQRAHGERLLSVETTSTTAIEKAKTNSRYAMGIVTFCTGITAWIVQQAIRNA